MKVVLVYLRLYGECLRKAGQGLAKNLWTVALPFALLLSFVLLAGLLVRALGIVGGFAAALLRSAVVSCYLYFVGEIVAHSRVSLSEFRTSIGAYFWSAVNLFFLFWMAELVLGFALAGNPRSGVIYLALTLAALVLLNAAPEVIYQRGTRNGLETVQRSVKFIQENWIEWFIPNALALAALWYAFSLTAMLPWPIDLAGYLGVSLVFHLLMVFRGHLFRALDGSSHRQRMFRYRTAGSRD